MRNLFSKAEIATSRVIVLLLLEFVAVIVPVIILGKYFNFPEILREPATVVFEKFRENQYIIISGYYVFLISSLLYIPLSYSLAGVLYQSKSQTAKKALLGFGIATALFQSIGFVRWIFTMPYLTDFYFANTENERTATALYEILNRFAGMSIGEHLGFLAMGCWTISLGIVLVKHTIFRKWIGYLGICIGIMLVISTIEHFGGVFSFVFGLLNFCANTFWSIWLIVLIIEFLRLKLPDISN